MGNLATIGATLGLGASADDILFGVFDAALTETRVRFILPKRTYDIGKGGGDPEFILRITDSRFARRVLTSGNLGMGETYMEGGWTMERGRLDRFIATLAVADVDRLIRRDPRLVARIAAMRARHALINSARRVKPHYDVGADVYELFLDETMGYSCGYQQSPDDSLETLQKNKYDRVCQKLRLREGERILDIGCGWGGLIIHAAQHYGVRAHGISPAPNQVGKALARAKALGLESRVTAEVADFRDVKGSYDKVSSVGMFEHLYPHEHAAYFARIKGWSEISWRCSMSRTSRATTCRRRSTGTIGSRTTSRGSIPRSTTRGSSACSST